MEPATVNRTTAVITSLRTSPKNKGAESLANNLGDCDIKQLSRNSCLGHLDIANPNRQLVFPWAFHDKTMFIDG